MIVFGGKILLKDVSYHFILGGGNKTYDDIYTYNVQTTTWTKQNPTGILPGFTYYHTAALTTNNMMLVFGGYNTDSLTYPYLLQYDVSANHWVSQQYYTDVLKLVRTASVITPSDEMIIFGGEVDVAYPYPVAFVYSYQYPLPPPPPHKKNLVLIITLPVVLGTLFIVATVVSVVAFICYRKKQQKKYFILAACDQNETQTEEK